MSLHQAEELGGMFCNTSSRLGHTWVSTLQRWEIWEYSELSLPLQQQRKQHMNLGKESSTTESAKQVNDDTSSLKSLYKAARIGEKLN